MIKNMPFAEVVALADLVQQRPGEVASRTLVQNEGGSLTLFAFAAGEALSAHTTPADALVYVLDGAASVEIDGKGATVRRGEAVVMPANAPHAITAHEDFKMLLFVSR